MDYSRVPAGNRPALARFSSSSGKGGGEMAKSAVYYKHWLEHDGKPVSIDGVRYTLRAKSHEAIHPIRQQVVTVLAEPCNRRSKAYLEERAKLGDDWDIDVLDSSCELQADLLRQVKSLHL